jgi:hypothetical protein
LDNLQEGEFLEETDSSEEDDFSDFESYRHAVAVFHAMPMLWEDIPGIPASGNVGAFEMTFEDVLTEELEYDDASDDSI